MLSLQRCGNLGGASPFCVILQPYVAKLTKSREWAEGEFRPWEDARCAKGANCVPCVVIEFWVSFHREEVRYLQRAIDVIYSRQGLI